MLDPLRSYIGNIYKPGKYKPVKTEMEPSDTAAWIRPPDGSRRKEHERC